jgi:lysine 2,3-aminomutase
MGWKADMKSRFRRRSDLEGVLPLWEGEKAYFDRSGEGGSFPVRITSYTLGLMGSGPDDPLRRQFVPTSAEFSVRPYELADPLGESEHTPVPRLIHRYPDRALLLVTDECAANCRYCFRRAVTGRGRGAVTSAELLGIAAYLAEHREIKELLLSGGDPLTLEDRRLFDVIDRVRGARPGIILRIGTRVPGVLPSRITRPFARGLSLRRPVWIVLHINHPRELTPEFTEAADRLAGAGVPLLSQTVLLRGINDEASTLEDLFRGLMSRGIKPYYLFQGDLAAGTSHFRVPLETGFALMKDLRRRLSAMALPVFAVDLPGGGGKIPLTESYLREETGDCWVFESIDGKRYTYPKEG